MSSEAESSMSRGAGKPLGLERKRKTPSELSTNRHTARNRKHVDNMDEKKRARYSAVRADKQAIRDAIHTLKEKDSWKKGDASIRAYLEAEVTQATREDRHRKGISCEAKMGNISRVGPLYSLIKTEAEDDESEQQGENLSDHEDTKGKIQEWLGDVIVKMEEEEGIELESGSRTSSHKDAVFIDLTAAEDNDTTVMRVAETNAEIIAEKDEDETHPYVDETNEALFGNDNTARQAYIAATKEKNRITEEKRLRESLWLTIYTFWHLARVHLYQKLNIIDEKVSNFEGSYAMLVKSGILEEIVQVNPETGHNFELFLLSNKDDVEQYTIASWADTQPAPEEEESVYSAADELDDDPNVANSNVMIENSLVEGQLESQYSEDGHGNDETNTEPLPEEDGHGNDEMNTERPPEEDSKDTNNMDEQMLEETWVSHCTDEDPYAYRNEPGFYIPAHCLFSVAEISLLCNMASHTADFDLEDLGVWPEYLDLEASAIVPNNNIITSARAWELLDEVEVDENDGIPTAPAHITSEMLLISDDPMIFDLTVPIA